MKPVKIEVMSFCPTEWEQKAMLDAQRATGRKRSELLRRCFRASIVSVVKELTADQQAKVQAFMDTFAEGVSSPLPGGARQKRHKTKRSPKVD